MRVHAVPRLLILLLPLFGVLLLPPHVLSENSPCVKTQVGSAGPSPTDTPNCLGGAAGDYQFPLNIGVVGGIATEMAAYPGGYTFEGHREHAGLDISAPVGQHTPVYSVTNGTVIAARDSCYDVSIGSKCRIDISNDGDHFISSYTHVNVNSSIRVGTKVSKGQQIAVVHYWTDIPGMDHLHFEMQDKNRLDSLGVPINVNPRNYFPQLQQFKPYGYGATGADVRAYTNSVGYNWADDGKEYAETFRNHPPCPGGGDCWAH